jgi:hypothetical protein
VSEVIEGFRREMARLDAGLPHAADAPGAGSTVRPSGPRGLSPVS